MIWVRYTCIANNAALGNVKKDTHSALPLKNTSGLPSVP